MSGLLIFVRNIEACRTLGRPIYTGYSPLNKGSSLEKQQKTRPSVSLLQARVARISERGGYSYWLITMG
jgi:hypothetical protein